MNFILQYVITVNGQVTILALPKTENMIIAFKTHTFVNVTSVTSGTHSCHNFTRSKYINFKFRNLLANYYVLLTICSI